MPQLIEFPPINNDPRAGVSALVRVCRDTPAAGEPLRDFRVRLRGAKLLESQRPLATLRFLGVEGDPVVPSPFMSALAAAGTDDAVATALANRLWSCNPILAKAVLELLQERAYGKDEIYKFLGSASYHGRIPSRPEMEGWLHLASAAGVIKAVGIAVTLAAGAAPILAQAADLDVDEYLAADTEPAEPSLPPPDDEAPNASAAAGPVPLAAETSIPVAAAAAPGGGLPGALRYLAGRELVNPRNVDRPVPVARFAPGFSPDVLAETADRIATWIADAKLSTGGYLPSDFALDAEVWVERADEVVYRVAVAAALVFRLDADRAAVVRSYAALDAAGVLADLYHGTVPEVLPGQVDARALMLASLAARRCAESPELANQLSVGSAANAFASLDAALGRGLFRVELIWMLSMFAALGVMRPPDLEDFTVTPHRIVRDTLFRLGFLDSPYATDSAALALAAKAARQAIGARGPADALAAFAIAAGCGYECPNRKTCGFACRERLE